MLIKRHVMICVWLSCTLTVLPWAAAEPQQEAEQILAATNVQGGFIVHIGCGDGSLTAALRTNDRYLVHGLDSDPINVLKARRHIQDTGSYGLVSVDRLDGSQLPYIANMVNLLVSEDLKDIPMSEVQRVLAPQGIAYIKHDGRWQPTTKPRPENIDEWTHFLHDATGNAVAHDDVVGPPRHLQWLSGPRWSRHHDRMASMSALVSAGGRIFYIMDEGSRISIQMPARWTLIARDAFNGTLLWKQPIKTWGNHLWPLKSGPTPLARRLVANADRVYVTLGLNEPISALDAATGELLQTYEATARTEEILHHGDGILALVNDQPAELSEFGPKLNLGDQRRVRLEYQWNRQARRVVAIQVSTGEQQWSYSSRVAPLSLATDAGRVFFHDGEKLVCLSRQDGEKLWETLPIGRRQNADMTMNFGPRLVVYGDIVLFAGGDRSMRAIDVTDGKILWTAPHARGGYQSPEDLLVSGGLVWSAPTTGSNDSGVFTGRDLRTGEVKTEFPPDVETYWFHHRCYIAKATDKYLLPSRTGIEFVDYKEQKWDIHHWVRGGCLYGIMPCNGLVYAPPHNCACYPEAKLYGMNALAPAAADREVGMISDEARLEQGPAYQDLSRQPIAASATDSLDWPTYRHDAARSGSTGSVVSPQLTKAWTTQFAGRLSSVVVAAGRLFVSEIDKHTVHALDATTGQKLWSYSTGARVDSPPTVAGNRVLFGSADGWLYCVRADNGILAWRFRAAPRDQRLVAFGQLESVWPVHGTPLVEDDTVYLIAGRSNFLDGGLRFIGLDIKTGEKLVESVIDDKDPETGENIQARLQVLNMPVGLPDILSSDGRYLYMRSQRLDRNGFRHDLGPHSGKPPEQGSVQAGETAHLFAPMGYLDDTYFHRAYWVYGKSFAGGHGGYFQAGKYAPSGRILVSDRDTVYGFGRNPEYLKWTTTIEHQLFATSKQPPAEARESLDDGRTDKVDQATMVKVSKSPSLNPKGKPLLVSAWVQAKRPDGVVVAHGGPSNGFALLVRGGKPQFVVRSAKDLASVAGKQDVVGRWVHLAGVLTQDQQLELYVDGKLVGRRNKAKFVGRNPIQALEIGADDGGSVGNYRSPLGFTGLIDEVRVFYGKMTAADVSALAIPGEEHKPAAAKLVLAHSFEEGRAADRSGLGNDGEVINATRAAGRTGAALRFNFRRSTAGGTFVQHKWRKDIPLIARAMVKAADVLFVAGPPDVIDEEKTFQRQVRRDPKIAAQLAEQDAALDGKQGGILRAVSVSDGETLADYRTDSLPVWDGLVAAKGRLYLATTSGHVVCYAAR
jgi:outer membrane protein assembly factor BamB